MSLTQAGMYTPAGTFPRPRRSRTGLNPRRGTCGAGRCRMRGGASASAQHRLFRRGNGPAERAGRVEAAIPGSVSAPSSRCSTAAAAPGSCRDELGVLPPGDILKCALTLAANEKEARRVLLSRLPALEDARLGGHTGGNLLLSMMERYSGNFMAAVEGLSSLLGCRGRVWPVSVDRRRSARATPTATSRRARTRLTRDRPRDTSSRRSGSSRRSASTTRWPQPCANWMPSSSALAVSIRACCLCSRWRGMAEAVAVDSRANRAGGQPAHGRARDGWIHRGRRSAPDERGHRTPGGRVDQGRGRALGGHAGSLRRRAQGTPGSRGAP